MKVCYTTYPISILLLYLETFEKLTNDISNRNNCDNAYNRYIYNITHLFYSLKF